MKTSPVTSFVLGGIPLIVYPFCLIANVMSIAGASANDGPMTIEASILLVFIWGTTLYPLIYLGSLVYYFVDKANRDVIPSIPLAYLVVVTLPFAVLLLIVLFQ
jgi:hypothetical protein